MAASEQSQNSKRDEGGPTGTEDALSAWLEKLDFLRLEEAKLSDPAQRFTIKKQIKEAETKIAELATAGHDSGDMGTSSEPDSDSVQTTLPPRPELFIGRSEDLRTVKAGLGIAVTDTDHQFRKIAVVRGYPGVGKTSAAIELAHDPDVAEVFQDGILWTSLGQQPQLHAAVTEWGRALGHDELLMRISHHIGKC